MIFESWGRFPKVSHLGAFAPKNSNEVNAVLTSLDSSVLPRGLGRSYGDSCLNENGYLIETRNLKKIHGIDSKAGLLKCDCGITLGEILRLIVSKGWFLPVTPGTKFVTVGGAIANDVHGKNHHKAGNFGNHVIRLELLRSDGSRILCSKDHNAEWFHATIGGLGLTGIILWAEFKLKPIHGPFIEMESIRFRELDEFVEISKESDKDYEYTVSWLDCSGNGNTMGRGIFIRGNHSERKEANPSKTLHGNSEWKSFPVDAPSFLLSTVTIKAFNFLFYHKQLRKYQKRIIHYDSFFYPLDKIGHWNRMYGKRGFLQWQCVVPSTTHNETMKKIVEEIAKSRMASFLVVLKEFGNLPSEGMLSFPIPGATLALDFANQGQRLFTLLDKLDEIVLESGGRIYPAKDARMSAATFRASFPEFRSFIRYIDPKFSSSFFKRINGNCT